MQLVQVKIIASIDTSRYGAMSYGDMLRTDEAFARHLVEDCFAAVYVDQQEPEETSGQDKPRKTRKAKDKS